MTIILTCLTQDFIVPASDRRVTAWQEGKLIYKDDERNKALIYDNHTVFAHTGLAILENQQFAIDWAAERLAQLTNLQDAMAYLCECATRLLETPPFSSYPESERRLGFVGAGYINFIEGTQSTRRPGYLIISNFMNHEGKLQPPPYNKFKAYWNLPLPLEKSTFKLFRSGQALSKGREEQLNRTLRRYFQKKHNRVWPEKIGWLLTHTIQEAAESNEKIGKNVICTFVPRNYREDTGDNREIHIGGVALTPPVSSREPQQLTPPSHLRSQEHFMMPPLLDLPRCLYISGDDSPLPLYKAVNVFPGLVIPVLCTTDMVFTIPPVRLTGIGEMEITAGNWSGFLSAKVIKGKKV